MPNKINQIIAELSDKWDLYETDDNLKPMGTPKEILQDIRSSLVALLDDLKEKMPKEEDTNWDSEALKNRNEGFNFCLAEVISVLESAKK